MTAIAFTEGTLQCVKRALRASFPDAKSSFLTEALASACGYRTHAGLMAALERSNQTDPDFVLLNDEAFIRRLYELEQESIPEDEDFEWFEALAYPNPLGIVRTKSSKFFEVEYVSARAKAWRNMMVAGINAGIERRLFTVLPGDNRWPGAPASELELHTRSVSHVFNFNIGGIPALGYVADIGYAELSIHVVFWPSKKGEEWIAAGNPKFIAGEACARGWLERSNGAWLQSSSDFQLTCRRNRVVEIASLEISPRGFADRGDFKR